MRVDPPPDCDAFEQDWGPKDNNLVGQVRRLGETGPVYVVLRLVGGDHAEIEIPVTGEKITLTVAEILANPQE